jgi:hypothetical protein
MNTQELNNIINRLKSYNSNVDAYFEFFGYGGGPNES